MKKIIAKIGLAQGQVGFYDQLTNIHLTMTSPFANIYQGMNTSRIKASIASKRLNLISGSLDPEEIEQSEVKEVEPKVKVKTDVVEPKVEEPAEPVVEEVKAEPKKTAKKKSTKKVEEATEE